MKYDIPAALQALKPGAEWVLRGDALSGLEWLDKKPYKTFGFSETGFVTKNVAQNSHI